MKRLELRVFRGANIHAHRSVVRLLVETGSHGPIIRDALLERMVGLLPDDPSWQTLCEAVAARTGDIVELDWVEVLGRLALELQEERYPTDLAFTVEQTASGARLLLIGFHDAEVGRLAVALACDVTAVLQSAEGMSPAVHAAFAAKVRAFFERRSSVRFNWITSLLAEAAEARGVPVAKLLAPWPTALFGQGRLSQRMIEASADSTSIISSKISRDKVATSTLLRECFVPMPPQLTARSAEEIMAARRQIGFPLVVKGRHTDKGRAVTTGIMDDVELERAVQKVRAFGDQVVIEKHIAGDDYRMTVIGFRLAAAVRRIPAQVVGDGVSSIRTLVERENARRRGHGRYARWIVPLILDREALAMLAREGLNADSVPAPGQTVPLRSAANLSQGGLAEDVTDHVHPDVARAVERACRLVRLDFAGVDVISSDISRPFAETGGVILELNGLPGLRPHYVTLTPARDVAGAAIDYLFPAPQRGRIPSVVVTGTNGKTTTCRMTARIFEAAGLTVGLTSTSGIAIGGAVVAKGDHAGSRGAMTVLRDPSVEAAVLEMARGGMLAGGLGIDHFEVGVLTNVTRDHLGTNGIYTVEQMARVKRLIVEPARRAVVLNADDVHCAAMGAAMRVPVWWITRRAGEPMVARHVAQGGDAVLVMERDGIPTIVHRRGDSETQVIAVAEVPATLDGAASHNVENALAATAAALALQQPLPAIRSALSSFDNSFDVSPGRLNIHDCHGVRIVVDYAHNEDGVRKLNAALRSMPVAGVRRCVVLAARSKDLHREVYLGLARAKAELFERFIVAEIGDIRAPMKPGQRPLGDSAALMTSCLREAGVAEHHVRVVLDTHEAVDTALAEAEPGDLVLLAGITEYEKVWQTVSSFRPAWATNAS